ncbi:MAG TPA: NUDIX domain-containing protein [Candidatus Magasanikbacteria bacterium]|mgnify:CR=1 FL=1|nr:NUDIX domain-containing protein [Candidatus Magasanikbacteria bacterium]
MYHSLKKSLATKPLIYVTKDLERALGFGKAVPGFFIISNSGPFVKTTYGKRPDILLIEGEAELDTRELLTHPKTQKFLRKFKNPQIVVFKNTKQIEQICVASKYQLLNPPAETAARFEEKVSQVEMFAPLREYLPDCEIHTIRDLKWHGEKFILQFNHSHTGAGTILVDSEKIIEDLQAKFPEREVRTARYIDGYIFTNNNIVWGEKTLIGNINFQITGMRPFTDNPFATVGNDWSIVDKILPPKAKKEYKKIVNLVAEQMRRAGWSGLFGVDIAYEIKTGKLYLIEINSRQPASTTYESILQNKAKHKADALTVFEAHLAALLRLPLTGSIIPINSGAQVTQKVTDRIDKLYLPKIFRPEKQFSYLYYRMTGKPGAELMRLMTDEGIMANPPTTFNDMGVKLADFVFCARGESTWNAPRAAGVITHDGKILLMKRKKLDREYFVIPGGTVDVGETLTETLKREILEETNLEITLTKQKPIHTFHRGRDEYYFFITEFTGEAELGGPEKNFSNPNNSYELVWINLHDIPKINLLPTHAREIVAKLK